MIAVTIIKPGIPKSTMRSTQRLSEDKVIPVNGFSLGKSLTPAPMRDKPEPRGARVACKNIRSIIPARDRFIDE